MSYENRKAEFERLKGLGRDKDIPDSLKKEFGKDKPSESAPEKNKRPEVKKKEDG